MFKYANDLDIDKLACIVHIDFSDSKAIMLSGRAAPSSGISRGLKIRVATVLLTGSLQTLYTLSARPWLSAKPSFKARPVFDPPPLCLTKWVAAQKAWLQLAVESPSTDSSSGVEIHILGVDQQSVNCKLISEAMRRIQPDAIAIEGCDVDTQLFVGEDSIGSQLDSQLDTIAAASWQDHGRWTSQVKCEKVLSLDQLCSWYQTVDAVTEANGWSAPMQPMGFLPLSGGVAACRAAARAARPGFFVDCDAGTELYNKKLQGMNVLWQMGCSIRLCATDFPVRKCDYERAGLDPLAAAELKRWLATNPDTSSRIQMAGFMQKSQAPSLDKQSDPLDQAGPLRRMVCGLDEWGKMDYEQLEPWMEWLFEKREVHMHGKLMAIARGLPSRNFAQRLLRVPARKILFVCGQGHVGGISKLFADTK